MTREELDAGGWINCCPERAMNEVIEQRHGIPALSAAATNPLGAAPSAAGSASTAQHPEHMLAPKGER